MKNISQKQLWTSMAGLKNSHTHKNLTTNDKPQNYSWECRRRRWRQNASFMTRPGFIPWALNTRGGHLDLQNIRWFYRTMVLKWWLIMPTYPIHYLTSNLRQEAHTPSQTHNASWDTHIQNAVSSKCNFHKMQRQSGWSAKSFQLLKGKKNRKKSNPPPPRQAKQQQKRWTIFQTAFLLHTVFVFHPRWGKVQWLAGTNRASWDTENIYLSNRKKPSACVQWSSHTEGKCQNMLAWSKNQGACSAAHWHTCFGQLIQCHKHTYISSVSSNSALKKTKKTTKAKPEDISSEHKCYGSQNHATWQACYTGSLWGR